ncbi:hypothetical protein [Candidatus Uabimicrobium sp. HlEnr_7]|uniref:hypothetical protein n=1 Tax=Candidatus Uabimicrobium helgolandensis TaxID=3095367 RepID=UPI0035593200
MSIINVTKMKKSVRYRHVLLLDEKSIPLRGNHAGRLTYVDGEFYLPDSQNNKMLVFPITEMREIPKKIRKKCLIIDIFVQTRSYSINLKPSFVSYDWSRKQFLVGSFH